MYIYYITVHRTINGLHRILAIIPRGGIATGFLINIYRYDVISYSQKQDRKQKELETLEAEKRKVEEERLAHESAKFKRRLSFDKWLKVKEAAKLAADKAKAQKLKQKGAKIKTDEDSVRPQQRRSSIVEIDFEALNGSTEERKKHSEEVYRKWLIKKELEEIKKAREMLLRLQHPGFAISPPGENHSSSPVGRRRGSFVDANPELHVAANRHKSTNSAA